MTFHEISLPSDTALEEVGLIWNYYYIPSPNPQKRIRPTDEVINDVINDEMMIKVMMKLWWNWGEDCFKMFSSHERLLGPRIRT